VSVNGDPAATHPAPARALAGVEVRVSAEIGRTRLPVGRVVDLQPGAIVELDRGAEDPAELYVNGRRFGAGRLILVDGEWALRIEWISGAESVEPPSSDTPAA
jgi:flagellar motor switch protein FliN/FliY